MAHTFSHLCYHFIFSTKDRIASIGHELKPRLHAYIGGILRELKCTPLAIGGTADHVHVLPMLPTTACVSDVMRIVKTNSSRWARREMRKRTFGWQTGYAAFTVSRSSVRSVARYVAEQETHHRRRSFKDEFIALLKKHGVEYDERYIWT